MEKIYATVLWRILLQGTTLSKAVDQLSPVLKRRGRTGILPRVLRELRRMAEKYQSTQSTTIVVAREEDIVHARKQVAQYISHDTALLSTIDPRVIGGWRLESPQQLIDVTYKQALLDIYRRATQ